MRGELVRPIVIAAGGTGGHFFPAEALGTELAARGHRVALMTDRRSRGQDSPAFAGREVFVLRGGGIAGRGARRALLGAAALGAGTAQARTALTRLNASAIVGFGGYPSVPPVLASRLVRPRPRVILHEQNAVLGRANRLLARFADRIALGMQRTALLPARPEAIVTGNPVRPEIVSLAGRAYAPPTADGPIRVLVTGGSQGARVFSDVLPQAIRLLPEALRARLRLAQQCRPEDLDRARAAYAGMGVEAELSPFFSDMAQRLASAHFVVARAGASTVAELAVVGVPALLIPFPHAIDNHQFGNAEAVGAAVLKQADVERRPQLLADALVQRLLDPAGLAAQARATASYGIPDAARRLADVVEQAVAQEISA